MSLLLLFNNNNQISEKQKPEFLLQTEIITVYGTVSDGQIIKVSAPPWKKLADEVINDPEALYYFANNPRKFEEFLAGSYKKAGWDEVILTPRSNDGGRDVIAIKKGYITIRILDQAKAYSHGHLVNHDDVRAMLGVLQTDSNSSKGIITTTSDFQPNIYKSEEFKRFIPYKLSLKNGSDLQEWLKEVNQE